MTVYRANRASFSPTIAQSPRFIQERPWGADDRPAEPENWLNRGKDIDKGRPTRYEGRFFFTPQSARTEAAVNHPRLPRPDRLKKINDVLLAYGFPPWDDRRLGKADEGQCEIIDLADVAELDPRRIELALRILDPGGGEHDVKVRFGGFVAVVLPLFTVLEGQAADGVPRICLAKRWRVESGVWTYEAPRCLVHDDEYETLTHPRASAAHRVLAATFGADALDGIGAARVEPLGEFPLKGEASPARAFLVAAAVLRPFSRKRGDGAVVKLTWDEAMRLVEDGRYLNEPATAVAFGRAAKRFGEALSRRPTAAADAAVTG